MSFENFLQFWSVHNRQIIEFGFVATFIIILFVIYRQFFTKTESTAGPGNQGAQVSIDTSEIEEKLKKILENQSLFKTVAPEATAVAPVEPVTPALTMDTQAIEKLKNEIKQKEQIIEELKKVSVAAAANKGGGDSELSKEDAKKLEDKIKELEGRLQEYEIISEDIADLSFYKEENARLQKELDAKSGAPVALSQAAPVTPTPAAVDTVVPAVTPAVETAPAPVEASASADSVIDDDILKEFAAAVEGQKATGKEKKDAKAEAAPDVPAAEPPQPVEPQKMTELKGLMGEFENFIKKG